MVTPGWSSELRTLLFIVGFRGAVVVSEDFGGVVSGLDFGGVVSGLDFGGVVTVSSLTARATNCLLAVHGEDTTGMGRFAAAHSASAGGGKAAARRAEERGAPFSRPRAGLGKGGVEELCQSSQPGLRALVLCMAGSKVPCAWHGPATPPQALGYCLY